MLNSENEFYNKIVKHFMHSQERQTQQNSGGVEEVTQHSGPFFKGSIF